MYPTFRNKQKKLKERIFFVGILKATARKNRIRFRNPMYGSKDPDSYVSKWLGSVTLL